jgi:hypothetical protein
MRVSELIEQLERLKEKYGNVDVSIWLSYTKESRTFSDVYFDDELKDIYIGVYA